ncbi:MAG: hypothetical protein EPN21_09380 [Methylococcaceae bacterium]|nr:MAG: hypothetical protein EPN21_09380 [Methylococcaceae bacterium]
MSTIDIGGLTSSGFSQTDSVTPGFGADPNDYYNFSLSSVANVNFSLTGVSGGDADLYLYQDTGTDVFPIGASTWGGNSDEFINTILNPGNYIVSVSPFYGNVGYTLGVDANFPSAPITDYSDWGMSYAYNLGALTAGSSIGSDALPENSLALQGPDLLGNTGGDWDDAYSFTIDAPSTVTISLTPDANSAIVLELYDSEDQWITGSYSGYADTLTADLVPGTYWVDTGLAWTDNNNGNASYDLSFSAVDNTPPAPVVTESGGDAASLANGMLSADGSITLIDATYSGDARQAVLVNNFAGEQNSGILISTGNAVNILGQSYNEFAGADTTDTETVKNWANSGGPGATGRSYMQQGNAGFNDDVFNAMSELATAEADSGMEAVSRVYDAASLSFNFSTSANSVNFDLMFGSEEFPFFANKYVDGAVILVDGVNYALFDLLDPTTLLSVTQSNVDAGYFNANTQYDADGNVTDNDGVVTSTYATEFNGISDLISILAPLDTTLESHNITISIADTNDHVLDSGLFMSNLHGVDIGGDGVGRDDLFGLLVSIGDETTGDDTTVGGDTDDYTESSGGDDSTDGGNGRDVLFGDAGSDSVEGGGGDDYVDGGVGDDVVTGDAVEDTTGGAASSDTVDGGNDTLSGGAGDDSVDGGEGRDDLFGDEGTDSIDGGAGTDSVDGGTGSDTIDGGLGSDSIIGDDGSDTTASNDDTIDSGEGDDYDCGGSGADWVDGGLGDDVIWGENTETLPGVGTEDDNDTLEGGDGNDSVTGGLGSDDLSGGDGRDSLFGGAGNDVIDSGTNTDTASDSVSGGDGNDTVTAGAGADVIAGDVGNDSVSGGDGNDTVSGGTGNDVVSGDLGNDTVSAGTGNDSVSGGVGNDQVIADVGNDSVSGGDGNDSVNAGAGSDSVSGGTGNDSVTAGDGTDTVAAGDGNDNVNAGAGNDTVSGDVGNDTVTAGTGNDSVSAGDGTDTVNAGAGNDTVSAGAGNDTVVADVGNDTVAAGDGNDTVSGGTGNDSVSGDAGNDTIVAGTGADTVSGGEGNDTINVGGDTTTTDTIVISGVSGDDIIVGFDAVGGGQDVIDIPAGDTVVDTTQTGGDVVVDLGSGDSITIVGVTEQQISDNIG